MKTALLVIASLIVPVGVAHADYIDDQIAKAETRVANAEKNLIKWRDCAANREECLATLREKADKAVASATARQAALK